MIGILMAKAIKNSQNNQVWLQLQDGFELKKPQSSECCGVPLYKNKKAKSINKLPAKVYIKNFNVTLALPSPPQLKEIK
jgi:hypothetical protein